MYMPLYGAYISFAFKEMVRDRDLARRRGEPPIGGGLLLSWSPCRFFPLLFAQDGLTRWRLLIASGGADLLNRNADL